PGRRSWVGRVVGRGLPGTVRFGLVKFRSPPVEGEIGRTSGRPDGLAGRLTDCGRAPPAPPNPGRDVGGDDGRVPVDGRPPLAPPNEGRDGDADGRDGGAEGREPPPELGRAPPPPPMDRDGPPPPRPPPPRSPPRFPWARTSRGTSMTPTVNSASALRCSFLNAKNMFPAPDNF
ncbi:MAG TPA: hypothetical protein VNQ76_21090, partial [Planctomicrobium sp.]|nr:hypothetical protein [Planctomicrobium sp.]